MDSNQYFTLEISGVSVSLEDTLVSDLFEIGAAGVQENLKFEQKDKKYLPEIVEVEVKNLIAYFEQAPDRELIKEISDKYPSLSISLNNFPIKDWLAEWKAQWKPFCLVGNHWIVPDWEKDNFKLENSEAIYIEPGMAFGTGTHATTQIASEIIVEAHNENTIESVVDVGTGSGILSLLLGKLGVANISAYDNDPESLRVFTENIEKNNVKAQWVEDWAQSLPGKVELCVANIIDGVLLELKPQFKALNSRRYIFTGVLAEREKDFVDEMTQGWNLELKNRKQKDEWVGFLFEAKL